MIQLSNCENSMKLKPGIIKVRKMKNVINLNGKHFYFKLRVYIVFLYYNPFYCSRL